MPRGYGGVGVLWKKSINHIIKPLKDGGCRIQAVITDLPKPVLIISVYLPTKGTSDNITEFEDCLDQVYELTQKYKDSHGILIEGDMNEDLSRELNSRRKTALKML